MVSFQRKIQEIDSKKTFYSFNDCITAKLKYLMDGGEYYTVAMDQSNPITASPLGSYDRSPTTGYETHHDNVRGNYSSTSPHLVYSVLII